MAERSGRETGFWGDLRGRAGWVVVGCLICQLGLGFGYVLSPLAADILGEFGWSRAEFSGARIPQLLATSATSPLVGWMVVRFGSRGVLTGATALIGISFVGLSAMQNLAHYYGAILVMGLGVTGLGDITVGSAVSEWVDRHRGAALGIVYTGSNLGGVVMTRVANAVSIESGWREALLWIGVGGAAVILPFAWFAVRHPRAGERAAPTPTAHPSVGRSDDDCIDLRGALRTRSFWILSLGLFAFFSYFLGMIDHMVLFLLDAGIDKTEATAYFSNAIGIGIASKLGAGWLADRIPRQTALSLDFGILTLSSCVLLTLPHATWIWVSVLAYGLSTAARDIVYPLSIQYCFGDRYMPEIYGAMMLALAAGVLGPLFAGRVFDLMGSYQIAFGTFALLNAAAFGGSFFIRNERVSTRPV